MTNAQKLLVVKAHVDFQAPAQDEELRFLPKSAWQVSRDFRRTLTFSYDLE
jgi:hypothetical protein